MKFRCRCLFALVLVAFSVWASNSAFSQHAALAPFFATTVQATQPLAYEPGDHSAIFTINRGNDTNTSATISYALSGNATNGVDYLEIPTSVTLAAGQSETNIVIAPVTKAGASGYKTVVLQLPKAKYRRFGFDSAAIYIAYQYTNAAPSITFENPTNNSSFLSKPNIVILARAGDSNGWITTLEFFANGVHLATDTNQQFIPASYPIHVDEYHGLPPIVRIPQENSFLTVWTNVPPGTYALTATATDNAGLQTTSAPINITVTTNLPLPAVRMVAPMNGSSFPSNAEVNLIAAAGELGGVIDSVEFLANGKSLRVVTNNPAEPWPTPLYPPSGTNIPWRPFYFLWTNAPVGSNTVTALATDNNGTQVLSAPVTIEVLTNAYHPRRWR